MDMSTATDANMMMDQPSMIMCRIRHHDVVNELEEFDYFEL
jgi:hypothetical protein